MDMMITRLELADFRNHGLFVLDDIGKLTVLVGRNGIGKTNVLEAVCLVTACESFKHATIAQLVKEGSSTSRVGMRASDGSRLLDVSLVLQEGKKTYELNGKRKNAAEMKGVFPSVSFTPDDLELAKKSSRVKRAAVDDLGMQLSKSYHVVCHDYEKTVRYKNKLLKDQAPRQLVESINDTLVICGSQLFSYRVSLFKRMLPHICRNYREISQSREELSGSYCPSWNQGAAVEEVAARDEVRDTMRRALDVSLDEELARGRCLVGPHLDQLALTVDGRDAGTYASQGQQRSVVLAWKMSEVEVIRQSLGVRPVLLLDDVMSELDAARREKFVNFVSDDVQVFITATDVSCFDEELLSRAKVVEL